MNDDDAHSAQAAPQGLVDGADLAAVAALLADGTRAQFCVALLDGRAWTASELARHAGVAASTATEHLNTLVSGGLLVSVKQGRHRYVRLAGPETAEVIERLSLLAPRRPAQASTLSVANRNKAMARARTCYDHLAGTLGVSIADAMTERGFLTWQQGLAMTDSGSRWLADLGVAVPTASRRPPLRSCLDWTERRPHLGGSVAAGICRLAFDSGWIQRIGTGRAVALTEDGSKVFQAQLGI